MYDDTRGLVGICYTGLVIPQPCDPDCLTPCVEETCYGSQLVPRVCNGDNFADDGHCDSECQDVAPKFSKELTTNATSFVLDRGVDIQNY